MSDADTLISVRLKIKGLKERVEQLQMPTTSLCEDLVYEFFPNAAPIFVSLTRFFYNGQLQFRVALQKLKKGLSSDETVDLEVRFPGEFRCILRNLALLVCKQVSCPY